MGEELADPKIEMMGIRFKIVCSCGTQREWFVLMEELPHVHGECNICGRAMVLSMGLAEDGKGYEYGLSVERESQWD